MDTKPTPTNGDELAEPHITINGEALSIGQALTVRVAIESFAFALNEGLGEDAHGKAMTALYRARINEIRALIFQRRR